MKNTLTYNVDWRSSRKKASSEARSEISKPKLRSWIPGATTAANEMMIKIVLSKGEHRDKIASKKLINVYALTYSSCQNSVWWRIQNIHNKGKQVGWCLPNSDYPWSGGDGWGGGVGLGWGDVSSEGKIILLTFFSHLTIIRNPLLSSCF